MDIGLQKEVWKVHEELDRIAMDVLHIKGALKSLFSKEELARMSKVEEGEGVINPEDIEQVGRENVLLQEHILEPKTAQKELPVYKL